MKPVVNDRFLALALGGRYFARSVDSLVFQKKCRGGKREIDLSISAYGFQQEIRGAGHSWYIFYSNYAKNTSHIAPFCASPHRLIILCEQNLDNAAILRYDSSNVSIFVHWYKGEV